MTIGGRRAVALLLALASLCLVAATRVAADSPGPSLTVEMLDAEGNPESLAGAHPDLLRVAFALAEEGDSVRDMEVELPPGLTGSSHSVPPCPRAVYESAVECPASSQVGRIEIEDSSGRAVHLPLFQVEPLPGETLALGSRPSLSVPLTAQVHPDDFGIALVGHELSQGSVNSGEFELWGIPADHQEGTSIPRRPLLTAPTECGPVVFHARMRSWTEDASWTSAEANTGASLSGCEELSFEPRLGLSMSEPIADSPTGLSLALSMPGEAEGSEQAPAAASSATIKLPSGITISPGGAERLVACTDAQFGLHNEDPVQCPEASRIGSAEFASEALGEPLVGTIYMGEEHPGERTRSFLVIPGPGFTLKMVSAMRIDSATGRIATVMEGLPRVQVQRIGFEFDGGPKALFATPLSCGRATAAAKVTPYGGGPTVNTSASVEIGSASPGASCGPPPFSPQLLVSDTNPKAGAPTTISTVMRRRPGEQLLRATASSLPAGIGARLGALTPCPSAAASAGSCPDGSRVGTARATIGSGSSPATTSGDVYFTGPYNGAPFGILTQFDGNIGPLDLGTITSRSALEVDRRTGRMTVSTTGLPERVDGLQVRFQSIELNMDRPGFLRNPTSCSPGDAIASFESQSGVVATARSPLRLHGCRHLRFQPRVRFALLGRRSARGGPVLQVTSRLPKGDSSVSAMMLRLPPQLKLGTGKLKELCPHLGAIRGRCPSGSRVGSVFARTPLLAGRMRGAVYMAQPPGEGLPDMWIELSGGGIRVDLRSRAIKGRDGRYASSMSGMPDMPMSTFTMRLGGSSGVVSLRRRACRHGRPRLDARARLKSQDGRLRSFRVPVAIRGACSRPRS